MSLVGAFIRPQHPKFRLHTATVAFRAGQYRIAVIVLLLPAGWSVQDETHYGGRGWRAEHDARTSR